MNARVPVQMQRVLRSVAARVDSVDSPSAHQPRAAG